MIKIEWSIKRVWRSPYAIMARSKEVTLLNIWEMRVLTVRLHNKEYVAISIALEELVR